MRFEEHAYLGYLFCTVLERQVLVNNRTKALPQIERGGKGTVGDNAQVPKLFTNRRIMSVAGIVPKLVDQG